MINIVSEDPDSPDAIVLLDELSDALRVMTGSSGKSSFDANDVRVANAIFVVARDQYGNAVGCGAFRPLESGIAEIKRGLSPCSGYYGSSLLQCSLESCELLYIAATETRCSVWLSGYSLNRTLARQ